MTIRLMRVSHVAGVPEPPQLMGAVGSSIAGASPNINTLGDFSIDYPLIHWNYSYYLTVCLDNENFALYSVRIWYEIQEAFESITLKDL